MPILEPFPYLLQPFLLRGNGLLARIVQNRGYNHLTYNVAKPSKVPQNQWKNYIAGTTSLQESPQLCPDCRDVPQQL